MKKFGLYSGIVIIFFSIISTIMVQCYWIYSVVDEEKKNFFRDSGGALFRTVQSLEQIEIADEIEKYSNLSSFQNSIDVFIDQCNYKDSNDEKYNFFVQKSMLAEDFFEHLYCSSQNTLIEQRTDKQTLDSVISNNLKNIGLDYEYQYAVYHPLRDTLFFCHNIEDKDMFLEQALFKVQLFPSDQQKNPAYLILNFPNINQRFYRDILPMVFISFLLIIITCITFILLFRMLYKQRKLSEIENDFINNMTHEFRTPISTISLAGQALSDPDVQKLPQLMDQYIKVINEENARLGSMAEKILTSATMENGKLKLKKENIDVNAIIKDVASKIKMQVEIKDGEIILDLTPNNSVIYADKMHFTNIISNLLDNANKYSPKKPIIKIITKTSNNMLTIAIKDNGIGISKQDQKKIFDKLYRVPSGNIHNFKGFGLGLSYVKFIVAAHKGKVGVESEPGKGSTFFIYLPLKYK